MNTTPVSEHRIDHLSFDWINKILSYVLPYEKIKIERNKNNIYNVSLIEGKSSKDSCVFFFYLKEKCR